MDAEGRSPFPEGLRLISHWGLRDEIRAQYAQADGLARQRLLALVMDRIVRQQIPAVVVDSADWQWDPARNLVRASAEAWQPAEREPDARYAELAKVFQAIRGADPFYPGYARRTDEANAPTKLTVEPRCPMSPRLPELGGRYQLVLGARRSAFRAGAESAQPSGSRRRPGHVH